MKTDTTSARTSRRSAGLQGAINLALVIIILLIANYLGFKYYEHRDLSTSQFYTLSGKTKDVLKKLDAPLRITTVLIDKEHSNYWDQTQDLLKEYQRVGGRNVTVEKVDSVYDRARAVELQNDLHFPGTDNIIILQYKDGHRIVKLDDLLDSDPQSGQVGGYKGEQEFTGAILGLEEGKVSHVYFTVGHGEHSLDDAGGAAGYGALAALFKSENIIAAAVNLGGGAAVPADADAVIIAGPTLAFSPVEARALDKYLAANGKLFILLDPFSPLGLDDLLKKYELGFDNDLVLSRYLLSTGEATLPFALIPQAGFAQQPITAKFAAAGYQMTIVNARSIHLQLDSSPAPKAQAILSTGPDAWGWVDKGAMTPEDLMAIKDRTFNPATDLRGPLIISAIYDGGATPDATGKSIVTGTRIVVVGSSHFLENDTADAVGSNFFLNALDWLVKTNAVLDILPKRPQQYSLSLSPMQERTVNWTAIFFIPGLCLTLGIFTWLSRRK